MARETPQSSGVQDLIARIRDDGVQAGRKEAEQILADARQQAARLVSEAKAEADEMRQKASEEIKSFEQAALEALKMAARDSRLQLEAEVLTAFEQHVKRLIAPVTYDRNFVRALVLVLAGHAVEEYLEDKQLQILVSDLLAGEERSTPEFDKAVHEGVLGISGDMLREGIEILTASDIRGGVRVRVVEEDLEIDLTDEAVSKLLLKHLLPRYRAILQGIE